MSKIAKDNLRKEVRDLLITFSREMEAALMSHADKGTTWRALTKLDLEGDLSKELAELLKVLNGGSESEIRHEAVDLANICMFIFERFLPE